MPLPIGSIAGATHPSTPFGANTAPGAGAARSFTSNLLDGLNKHVVQPAATAFNTHVTKPVTDAYNVGKYDAASKYMENSSPLEQYTPYLPKSLQDPANSALQGIQGWLKNRPDRFGQIAAAASPLLGGVMNTPMALPALLGLHGALAGGESAVAAKEFFKPMLNRLGGNALS